MGGGGGGGGGEGVQKEGAALSYWLSLTCVQGSTGREVIPICRLIDLSTVVRKLDHYVRLSREARVDIEWWVQYAEAWNRTSMMRTVKGIPPAAVITSDASGNWGVEHTVGLTGSCWSGQASLLNGTLL